MTLKLPSSIRWQQSIGVFIVGCLFAGTPCQAEQPADPAVTVYPVNGITAVFTSTVAQDEEEIVIGDDSPAPQDEVPGSDETITEPPAPESGEVVGEIQPAMEQDLGAGTPIYSATGEVIGTCPAGYICQPAGGNMMMGVDGCGCNPAVPIMGMPMMGMPMEGMPIGSMPIDSGMVSVMPGNNFVTPDSGIDFAPMTSGAQSFAMPDSGMDFAPAAQSYQSAPAVRGFRRAKPRAKAACRNCFKVVAWVVAAVVAEAADSFPSNDH